MTRERKFKFSDMEPGKLLRQMIWNQGRCLIVRRNILVPKKTEVELDHAIKSYRSTAARIRWYTMITVFRYRRPGHRWISLGLGVGFGFERRLVVKCARPG
jgi:hypothetical protein